MVHIVEAHRNISTTLPSLQFKILSCDFISRVCHIAIKLCKVGLIMVYIQNNQILTGTKPMQFVCCYPCITTEKIMDCSPLFCFIWFQWWLFVPVFKAVATTFELSNGV
eukprot:TRINITY_DN22096_c2_g1_i1.p1 TRINITY_DN22096_c2_g1~~TRINITY_DN22096_c2_g1_i1.p1  ORF type:complete len:109 (+),score=5.05 TRINITY_DN22096_c2_g1_i1:302-628(+)